MTSLIDKALSCVGLMRVAEHERLTSERVSIAIHNDVVNAFREQLANKEAKFKKAVTDLEAEVRARAETVTMNKRLTESLAFIETDRDNWRGQAMRNEADALLWRNARDKRAGKRGKANG